MNKVFIKKLKKLEIGVQMELGHIAFSFLKCTAKPTLLRASLLMHRSSYF